ncbi:MAG: hypothetical protein WCL04_07895 [Verrucomicrobiota bacterium]
MKILLKPNARRRAAARRSTLLVMALLTLGGGLVAWRLWSAKPATEAAAAPPARPAITPNPTPPVGEMPPPTAVAELPAPAIARAPAAPAVMPLQQAAELIAAIRTAAGDEAAAQATRLLIDRAYVPLYQQLNLSADEAAKMDDLLAQRLDAVKVAAAAATNQGLTDRTQILLLFRDAVTPAEGQINALLGDTAYQQYQSYAMPLRAALLNSLLAAQAAAQP